MSQVNRSNHDRAPVSAAFVKAMREVFGEVKVIYVKENGLILGETAPGPWVPVSYNPPEKRK